MIISDFLSPADVLVGVRAPQKRQLLKELAQKIAQTAALSPELINSALLKREDLGSTGTGGGIAIPHARIVGLEKPRGLLARLKQPIDFDSIDGEPVDVVFVLLLPATVEAGHLNALASVARRLRTPEEVARMRDARTPAELYAAIAG
jgi:PTS system nitrogen regulatory IIA component